MSTAAPILITGASGFLGSRLAERLVADGCSVVAACRTPSERLSTVRARRPDRFQYLPLDLRQELPRGAFSEARYRAVVHLASYVPSFRPVHPSQELASVYAGIIGATVRLLEELRGRTETLLLGSSVTVYGPGHTGLVDETACCSPANLYAVGKLATESICRCVAAAEQWNLTVLRMTQLYGDHEPHGLFFQRVFLPQARHGGRIVLTRGGREQKDLLWVDDAVDGIVRAIDHACPGTFNLSSGVGVTVRAIAEMLQDFSGGSVALDVTDDGSPAPCQIFDRRLASDTFGFRPTVSMREGLQRLWLE